jgi:hypothetical protein
MQVRTYVNGTLYCILERRKLREEARALNMDQGLRYLSNKSEPRFKRQIDYILSHLEESKEGEGDIEDDKSSDDSEDEIDEIGIVDEDAYESEIEDDLSVYDDEDDELDKVQLFGDGVEHMPRGEKWLMQEFLLASNEEATHQDMHLNSKIDEYNEERQRLMEIYEKKRMEASMHTQDDGTDIEKPHMRPLTPNKFSSSNNNTSIFEPDSTSRNAPSEIRNRQKHQRTPPDVDSRSRPSMSPISRNNATISSPAKSVKTDNFDASFERKDKHKIENGIFIDHNEEKKIIPAEPIDDDKDKKNKENEEKLKDPEVAAEFSQAFTAEDKIRRTPPKEAKMRYLREKKKKMQNMPHLYN